MLRIISATRCAESRFKFDTLLGQSLLALYNQNALTTTIRFGNAGKTAKGLPTIYNDAIDKSARDEMLVFVHDDVFIENHDIVTTLQDAFSKYDVIGLAGGIHRAPYQSSWFSVDLTKIGEEAQKGNLSGAVAHVAYGASLHSKQTSTYGSTPKETKLLDRVFLAAKSQTLKDAEVRFDERFRFHFYDLDFCRTCEVRELRMGTWNIPIVHSGQGQYCSPEWLAAYGEYIKKWGD